MGSVNGVGSNFRVNAVNGVGSNFRPDFRKNASSEANRIGHAQVRFTLIVVLAKTSTQQYSWDSTTCQAVRFLAEIESQLKLKLGSGKVGRPRKEL